MTRIPEPGKSLITRYTGEARMFLAGDREVAASLVDFARFLLGSLRNSMALGGIEFGKRRVTLRSGVIVEVCVAGGMHQCQIFVPKQGNEGEEEGSFPYLSGLHEVAEVLEVEQSDIRYATRFFPAFMPDPKKSRKWYELNVNLVPFAWPVTPPKSIPPLRTPPLIAFLWNWVNATLPPLVVRQRLLFRYPKWPTMYTGRMRMVVQKLLGRRLYNPFHIDCGIWLSDSGVPGVEQQRWVIEISQYDGVSAYPVYFYDELDMLSKAKREKIGASGDIDRYDYGFESSPVPPLSFGVDVKTVLAGRGKLRLLLLSAGALEPIYGEGRERVSPWYPNWAFSYDGHEAQIVVYENTQLGGYDIMYTKRYLLSVSGGAHPISASLRLLDEGYVKTDKYNFQLMVPILLPVQEQRFWESAATPPAYDSPIYSFYDRDNKEVVLRLKYEPVTRLPNEVTDTRDCVFLGVTYPAGFCPTDRLTVTAEKCNSARASLVSNHDYGTICYYCDRTFPPEYQSSSYRSDQFWWIGEVLYQTDWLIQCMVAGSPVLVRGLAIQSYELNNAPHWESEGFVNRVSFPIYEREGFFHYRDTVVTADTEYNSTLFVLSVPLFRAQEQKFGDQVMAVSAPYTASGGNYGSGTVTNHPAGEEVHDPRYRFIGSTVYERPGNSDDDAAVVPLDLPDVATVSAWFAVNTPAVAVIEAFSGKGVFLPEVRESWKFSTEYPVHECYRWDPSRWPLNLCFVGDGTGDITWRINASDKPPEFSEVPPEFGQKMSDPSAPIDLFAMELP